MERFIVDQAWKNVNMNEKYKRCIENLCFIPLKKEESMHWIHLVRKLYPISIMKALFVFGP